MLIRKEIRPLRFILVLLISIILLQWLVSYISHVYTIYVHTHKSLVERPSTGFFYRYFPNGRIKSVEYYTDGVKDSVWKYYYPNGKLKNQMHYSLGKLSGTLKVFSQRGELVYTELYQNGLMQERIVKNDSLYKYEFSLRGHGEILVTRHCSPCHEQVNESLVDKINDIKAISDTSSLDITQLDSAHISISDTLYSFDSLALHWIDWKRTYNPFDVEAIKVFLSSEQQRNRLNSIRNLRTAKKRQKIS